MYVQHIQPHWLIKSFGLARVEDGLADGYIANPRTIVASPISFPGLFVPRLLDALSLCYEEVAKSGLHFFPVRLCLPSASRLLSS